MTGIRKPGKSLGLNLVKRYRKVSTRINKTIINPRENVHCARREHIIAN
jgi:hypothetical protein